MGVGGGYDVLVLHRSNCVVPFTTARLALVDIVDADGDGSLSPPSGTSSIASSGW